MTLLPALAIAAPDAPEFAATIVIEAAVVSVLGLRLRVDPYAAVLVSILANAITQPTLHMSLPILYRSLDGLPTSGGTRWWLAFGLAEAVVALVEALLYLTLLRDLRRQTHSATKACGLSFAANGASAALGLLMPF